MSQIFFREVAVWGYKKGKCPKCGKRAVRQQKFYQTINPFNVNDHGCQKTEKDILPEIRKQRDEWMKWPTYHAKCE